MKALKDYTQEERDAVVVKCQKFGIGLILTGAEYIPLSSGNPTLWHQLVYKDRNSGNFRCTTDTLKSQYKYMHKKAVEADALDAADGDTTYVLTVYDENETPIGITYEDLAVLAYSAYLTRKEGEANIALIKEAKRLQKDIAQTMSPEELRKKKIARLEKLKEKGVKIEEDDDDI